MAYRRQIAYFDVAEDGMKKGNAGFCKWERKKGTHTITMSINEGIKNEADGLKVYTKSGICVGKLVLKNGRAEGTFYLDEDGQNWNQELVRVQIPLSRGGELKAVFPEEKTDALFIVDKGDVSREVSIEQVTIDNRHIPVEQEVPSNPETMVAPETVANPEVRDESEDEVIQEKAIPHGVVDSTTEEKEYSEDRKQPAGLWDSLATTNDTMRPFGTEEEYYRIALEDIYRLKEEYHLLRNNQFLLHGYYNYHYLILGKKEAEEEKYWLGVPGIYHEREKMAARMYGFEKFEGKKRNYGVGDLGYYLISAE